MSHHVKNALKSRALVFIFALAIAFTSLIATPVPATPAPAATDCPSYRTVIEYYTDSTYTVWCGKTIYKCRNCDPYPTATLPGSCNTPYYIETVQECQ
ncbi:MAG: hypothetical protein QOG00_248 [Pyrinomonadaceae bacterium]|nr:hypothetical protein [Pyrinomonadaceae bacterium]